MNKHDFQQKILLIEGLLDQVGEREEQFLEDAANKILDETVDRLTDLLDTCESDKPKLNREVEQFFSWLEQHRKALPGPFQEEIRGKLIDHFIERQTAKSGAD